MLHLIRKCIIWTIAASVYLLIGCTENRTNNQISEQIDQYVTSAADHGFSGALLVARNSKVILSKGYGLANREKQIPNTDQTVFTIGSITKQFTAAAILKLEMAGKLRVSDNITAFFPDVPEDKQSITLHHLLTHTAGFPGVIGDDFDPVERDAFVALAMQTPLLHEPGNQYEYSNVGYSLLGAVVEIVSGQPYEAFLREHLFLSAGMIRTGYQLPGWKPDDLAHGYRSGADWGTLHDRPWAVDGPGWHLRANGGILSTLGDMYRWHCALEGRQILSEKAKKAMFTPHVQEGENADSHYGYGWAIFTTPRNTRLVAHNGGNTIFAADMLRFVDEGVVIIGFSNTAGKPAWRVTEAVAHIVFGEDVPPPAGSLPEIDRSTLEHSPEGQHALALLKIWSGGNQKEIQTFILSHFHADVVKRNGMEKLEAMFARDRQEIGQTHLRRAAGSLKDGMELTLESVATGQWWLVTMRFAQDPPHTISRLGVQDTAPLETGESETDQDLDDLGN